MTMILLSPEQVAERLGLSRSTLAKLRLSGGGPRFIKLGAAVRYPENELVEWIEAKPRLRSTTERQHIAPTCKSPDKAKR